jgi:sec-independent protein translocase protein TatA
VIGDILQPTHLLFILVIALVVLGPKRLPEVGRSLGRGIRDFRNAMTSGDDAEDPPEVTAAQTTPIEPEQPAGQSPTSQSPHAD